MKNSLYSFVKRDQRLRRTNYSFFFSTLLVLFFLNCQGIAQTTVFSDDFSTHTGAAWTTTGQIGASAWTVLRLGDDWGARRNISPQQLELTNDASGNSNLSGWIFAMTPSTSFASPYNTILNLGEVVTWTFNIRQIRDDPSGFNSGSYGTAFILAGETATSATNGSGYAVVLGNPNGVDPLRLVRYTAGIMGNSTLTDIISSNTEGLADFGNEHLSVKVTYNPCLGGQWELFVRNDGASFADPLSGNLTSQGTAIDNEHAGTALSMMAAYWQGGTLANQTAFFDNVTVQVTSFPVANAGSYGPVCVNDPDVVLMGDPAGGAWSGTGVSGNIFNPDVGTQTLTYTVTDVNGCSDTDQTTITVNNCFMPPEMRWVLLENGIQNGTCISNTDCANDIVCFGLQYIPNVTGVLTSYTTGFFVDCDNGENPVISNASCVMTNQSLVQDGCEDMHKVSMNSSGNTGSVSVTQGTPIILHQVCFTIPLSSIDIIEDVTTDLTTSINPDITEFPSYATYSIDSSLDCTILPVRFLGFTAARYAELQSQLHWITADETNNSHFEIERSNNGGASFEKIGEVEAKASFKSLNQYYFIDEHARPGINYYRIRQFDRDGQFKYSAIRSVTFGDAYFKVSAMPNPVSDMLSIHILHADDEGQIVLIDVIGREVIRLFFGSGSSINQARVRDFEPGVYTLVVVTGSNRHEEKIVIVSN